MEARRLGCHPDNVGSRPFHPQFCVEPQPLFATDRPWLVILLRVWWLRPS